jgi:UDP:flavonoid glycosyltransferase YjiC (YdhE family)
VNILFAILGSLGDLHPQLALAREMRRRGHQVTFAATPHYRSKVESLDLLFHPLRPDWDPGDPDLIRQCEDLRRGPEILFRNLILPHLQDTYTDLLAAASNPPTDFMVAGELVFAAPLVAEKLRLRWASAILSPTSFFSIHDPSLIVMLPAAYRLRNAGPLVNRTIRNLGRLASRHWWKPVRDLRRQLGLHPDCEPVLNDKFSSDLNLALFSRAWAQPQPDWPVNTIQPGFAFYDETPQLAPEVTAFLAAGPPPIVFTQGSTAVANPGAFYDASAAAAQQLSRRALLIGAPPHLSSANVLASRYAPYAAVFPRAAAIVHQGGSGTTGQSLRAGKPTLFVPYGWDQPDNASRVVRLGAALTLPRNRYNAQTAAAALHRLLNEPSFSANASSLAAQLEPNAIPLACDALEALGLPRGIAGDVSA